MIDVVLAAALGRFGDLGRRLVLGADEQHASTAGDDVAHRLQRRVKHRHGLLQIDDVNAVAITENIGPHLGVPAALTVPEMNAGFQQLTHGEGGNRHYIFLRLCLRGFSARANRAPDRRPLPPFPACEINRRLNTVKGPRLQGLSGAPGSSDAIFPAPRRCPAWRGDRRSQPERPRIVRESRFPPPGPAPGR